MSDLSKRSILTFDGKAGKWDAEEFFRSGREEIAQVLREADALLPQSPKKRALDFGCGIGRLTQALAEHFEESHSVDIAPTMIELAGEASQFGDKVHYHLNPKNDLSLFPDEYFDFVYSNIVLQHIHSEMSRRYIQEFLRVLWSGRRSGFSVSWPPAARPTIIGHNGESHRQRSRAFGHQCS